MSIFSADPFSTLSAETLFASDFKPKKFSACPPTWQATAHIDPRGHLGHSSVLDNPLPVSCVAGYENAVRVMVQHLSQYVRYDTEMTPDVYGNTPFCEACNGVPEGADASDYALPDSLDYYARFSDGGRDSDNNISSCRSDEPYAKLRWVDYPSAGYMCQGTIRDYLNHYIKQRFSEEDYEVACADCTLGDIVDELLGGDDDSEWWEDYDPDAPVDCETGEWTKWGECVEGRQMRHKKVLKWDKNGGAPCDETRREEKIEGSWAIADYRACTPCEVSGWSEWSSCANGQQKRTKKDTSETEEEEYACAVLEEVRDCNTTNLGSGETEEEKAVPTWLWLTAAGVLALNFVG